MKAAAAWLRRRWNCVVVVTEMASYAGEEPDAIGWQHGGTTYLVECKASRSDFLADRSKTHRAYAGMGSYRYYMAPKGLLSPDEIPEGWGLVEVSKRKTIAVKGAAVQADRDWGKETRLLVSCLRRVGQNCPEGVGVNFYRYAFAGASGKVRATLGIMEGEDDGIDTQDGSGEAGGVRTEIGKEVPVLRL